MSEIIERWRRVCKTPGKCNKGIIPVSCGNCGWDAYEAQDDIDAEARAKDESLLNNCPKCGSGKTFAVGGDSIVDVGRGLVHNTFYKCQDCGRWWREED